MNLSKQEFLSTGGSEKARSKSAFEKRMDILIYAVHASADFTVKDIYERVVDCPVITIRQCLKDLIECGYLIKTTTYTFKATEMAKQLFGVMA